MSPGLGLSNYSLLFPFPPKLFFTTQIGDVLQQLESPVPVQMALKLNEFRISQECVHVKKNSEAKCVTVYRPDVQSVSACSNTVF